MYKFNERIKGFRPDYERMREVEDEQHPAKYRKNAVGINRIQELLAMAVEGVTTDDSYTEFEGDVVNAMRQVLYNEGLLGPL